MQMTASTRKSGSKTSFQETVICLFLLIKMKSDKPYEAYFVNQTKGKGLSQLGGSLLGFQGTQMQRGFRLCLFRGFYSPALQTLGQLNLSLKGNPRVFRLGSYVTIRHSTTFEIRWIRNKWWQ